MPQTKYGLIESYKRAMVFVCFVSFSLHFLHDPYVLCSRKVRRKSEHMKMWNSLVIMWLFHKIVTIMIVSRKKMLKRSFNMKLSCYNVQIIKQKRETIMFIL